MCAYQSLVTCILLLRVWTLVFTDLMLILVMLVSWLKCSRWFMGTSVSFMFELHFHSSASNTLSLQNCSWVHVFEYIKYVSKYTQVGLLKDVCVDYILNKMCKRFHPQWIKKEICSLFTLLMSHFIIAPMIIASFPFFNHIHTYCGNPSSQISKWP